MSRIEIPINQSVENVLKEEASDSGLQRDNTIHEPSIRIPIEMGGEIFPCHHVSQAMYLAKFKGEIFAPLEERKEAEAEADKKINEWIQTIAIDRTDAIRAAKRMREIKPIRPNGVHPAGIAA